MIATLGHLVLLTALAVAVAGCAASALAGALSLPAAERWGRIAAFAVLGLVALAVALMEAALIGHDFSVKYVMDVGSRETPLYYTIISLWGALEGSILFWALLVSLYTCAFVLLVRDRFEEIRPYATAVLLGVSSFFLLVIAGPGNPFVLVVPAPADGQGPNALLQNHWMMGVHPPLLYLGYVGLTVPFAIAMAALLRGSLGTDTFRLIRRWTLVPWVCLSLGIVCGMWWSYAVLGWGGYWSWDPVENASLMPWLVTTAFLHSLQVQERRQMLKAWTVSLVVAAFLLSVLGTFLTRSGVLASVHSFTQSAVGPVFLIFFAVVLVAALGLLFARGPELAAPGALESVVCRETAFLFNNLLLVGLTFVVLLGTLFPLIAEALQGAQLSVGAPYFNHVNVPIGIALVFLMGVGPALPWGATRLEDLQYRLLLPVVAGVALVLLLLATGVRGQATLATFGLVTFVLAVTLQRTWADVRARRRGTAEGVAAAARHLVGANPRRYGGYLAHVGLLMLITGIAASQTYAVRATATLHPGQSMRLDGYTLTYRGFVVHPQPNRMTLAAVFLARRGGVDLGQYAPALNMYAGQTVPTPAVREEPFDMVAGIAQGTNPLADLFQVFQGRNPVEDLYLVLQAVDTSNAGVHNANRAVTVQAMVNPLVGLIWLGGFVMGLGGLCALVPARRRRRATVPAPEPLRLQPEEVGA